MKEGRTYAVVQLSSFKRTHFADAKNLLNGDQKPLVITSGYDTMRVSLDGKLGIIKWRGAEPQGLRAHLIGTFDYGGILAYMNADPANWFGQAPWERVRTVAFIDSYNRPEVETMPPKERSAWKWAAVVAAAGAAATAAIYYLT